MGCGPSTTVAPVQLEGLLAAVRVGDRLEVSDKRALGLSVAKNSERCGPDWAVCTPDVQLRYAPTRPGYWWPASVVATSPTRGVKIHYAGYGSEWDAWLTDSANARLATVSDDLTVVPAAGTAIEVQLIQRAPFWARGTVVGPTTDGRVQVDLSVNRNHPWFSPSDFHSVRVPLRLLRIADENRTRGPMEAGQEATGPSAISVSGSGVSFVNGIYARDGTYGGCPLFKNGQTWLLRYRLPSGAHFWYLADKDRLDVNDGDYYRIRSEARWPPMDVTDQWTLARDGIHPVPKFEPMYDETEPAIGVPIEAHATADTLTQGGIATVMGIAQGVAMNAHDLPIATVAAEVVLPLETARDTDHGAGPLGLQPPGIVRQSSGAAAPPPPFSEIAAILRRELAITQAEAPSLRNVIDIAASMLGVDATHDKPLTVAALECWRVLGSPP